MPEIDRLVHEPVRLQALTLLANVQEAEFSFLLRVLRLTNGNLSVHMRKLEEAGYVTVTKSFVGRVPKTNFAITDHGRQALQNYWQVLDQLRSGVSDAAESGKLPSRNNNGDRRHLPTSRRLAREISG